MNLKQQRAAILKAARDIVDTAKAEDRDLTAAEVTDVDSKIDKIKALDTQIAAAAKSDALMGQLGSASAGIDYADGDAPLGGYGLTEGRLSFKGLENRVTREMRNYSAKLGRKAGLAPAGEVLTSIPVVNAEPLPGAAAQEPARPRLLASVPFVRRDAPAYRVMVQQVIANPGAAGLVAAHGLKPTLQLGVTATDARLRVVAVVSDPISEYDLLDSENLRQWVAGQLAGAVVDALELELLTGDGTGERMIGLANVSGKVVQAFQTDVVTTVQHGIATLEGFGLTAGVVAVSSTDYRAAVTQRNAGGSFDLGGAIDPAARTMWGVPTVVVPGLAAGQGWVLATDAVSLSTDGLLRVSWGQPDQTFQRNEVVGRVETRANLDILRPHGIVSLDLSAA